MPLTSMDRIKRNGRNGQKGLRIMCSVDGSGVSKRAFDLALTLSTKGGDRKSDSILLYHVGDSENPVLDETKNAAEKLSDLNVYKDVQLICEPKKKPIHNQIEEFIDRKAVDVVVMVWRW